MQLRAVDLKLVDHTEHQLGQKRAAIAVKQLVKRPPDAVVVEQGALALAQPQQAGVVTRRPLGQAVERLARHTQVAHQQPDRDAGGQRDPRVAGRQMARQQRLQADPS